MVRHLKPDPLGHPRNPFHVFLFIIILMNGLVIAFGVSTSAAVANALDPEWRRFYGLLLGSGAALVILGIFWPGDPRGGLLTKRTGYFGLGAATCIFAGAVIYAVRTPESIMASSITFAFGCICFWQVHIINRRVNQIIQVS